MTVRPFFSDGTKVLVVSHLYPSSAEPTTGIFIKRHVDALRRLGLDISVICPVPWSPPFLWLRPHWHLYGEILQEKDQPILRRRAYPEVPGQLWKPLSGIVMGTALIPTVRRIRETFKFDLIHAHCTTPDGLAAGILGRCFRVPSVCSMRGSDIHDYPFRSSAMMLATKLALRANTATVAVSHELADQATKIAKLSPPPKVIYNGVDTALFKPVLDKRSLRRTLDLPLDDLLLLYVGRLESDKGMQEMLLAFDAFLRIQPKAWLILVGEGSWSPLLKVKGPQVPIPQRLRVLGSQSPDAVAAVMSACDLFVYPSWREGMPNAVLEAMASGLAVVVTSVGGTPEVVRHGKNGLFVPLRDPKALVNALVELTQSEQLRSTLGEAARRTIVSRFSWTENAHAHASLYGELVHPFEAAAREGAR